MIHTAKQLKDKVSNISHGDSEVAQMMIRNFIMERFLERLSLSMYNANFILKGGMLFPLLLVSAQEQQWISIHLLRLFL